MAKITEEARATVFLNGHQVHATFKEFLLKILFKGSSVNL
jgi:hypothetical protein